MDMKHTRYILIGLVMLNILLRVIFAHTAPAHADEVIINSRAIDIIDAQRISTIDQMPLFHYLLDVLYKLFGISYLSARLASIVFGSLFCVLIYFLAKEFFSERAAIVAAVFAGFSSYLLRYQPESNTAMTFFFLLSAVLFFQSIRKNNISLYILSFIFLAIATLIKTIALMLLPSILIITYVYRKRLGFQPLIIGSLFYGLLLLPIFAYNVILYNQKGFFDILFVRYFPVKINPYANMLDGGGLSFLKVVINIRDSNAHFIKIDPLLFFFGLFGLVACIYWYVQIYRKQSNKVSRIRELFLVIFFPTAFLYASSLMAKHYVTTVVLICLFAGYALSKLVSKDQLLAGILVVYCLFSLFMLSDLFEKDAGVGLEGLSGDIPENSLVIGDSRIYVGAYLFPFQQHSFISAKYFLDIVHHSLVRPKDELEVIEVYFLECVQDYCIGSRHEKINETIERMVSAFIEDGVIVSEISQGGEVIFRLHKSNAEIVSDAKELTKKVNHFYFHNLRWVNPRWIRDWYVPKLWWEKLLHDFSRFLLFIELLIMAGGLVCVAYFFKDEKRA